MGVLEERRLDKLFPRVDSDTDIQARLRRYYEFWAELRSLLTMPRVYTFVTGKSAAFALLGLGLGRPEFKSPSLHKYVVLGALSEADIVEAFDESLCTDGTALSDALQFGDDSVKQHFLSAVAEVTAGQPRLVQHFLQNAAHHLQGKVLESKSAIKAALKMAEAKTRSTLLLEAHYTPKEPDSGPLFHALLLAGLLDVPIHPLEKFSFHGKPVRALELIDNYNFYITPLAEDSEFVRVRIAPCLARLLTFVHVPHWVANLHSACLLPLLDMEELPASLLTGGKILEIMLRTRLATFMALLGQSTTPSHWARVIPAFAGTAFANAFVRHPALLFPKVTTRAKKTKKTKKTKKANDDRTADAPIKLLGTPANTLVVPADQSSSPDLFLVLPENVVAFQCKFGNHPLSWADLRPEINNATPFATEEKPLSLVIVAFALGQQLLTHLNEIEVCV